MKRTLPLMLIASLAAVLASAAGDGTAGKVTYDKSCKSCHGANGDDNPRPGRGAARK